MYTCYILFFELLIVLHIVSNFKLFAFNLSYRIFSSIKMLGDYDEIRQNVVFLHPKTNNK